MPSWPSNRAGSRARTCWGRKGRVSPWRRPGWDRAGSTTPCDGLASADARFDLMCERAARRQLAPGDPLGSRQVVQEWIAESRASIEAARLLVLHAAWTIDAQGIEAAREAISLVKFHVAGVMQEVVDRAIQVHGALGISDDTVLSWFYRQERAARIYDGPDEVHKAVVARRILKTQAHRSGEARVNPAPISGGAVESRGASHGLHDRRAGPVRTGEQLDQDGWQRSWRSPAGGAEERSRSNSSCTGIRTSRTCSAWAIGKWSSADRRSATGSSPRTTWRGSTASSPGSPRSTSRPRARCYTATTRASWARRST